ncbi:hypothetical protein A6R68_22766, partial [Neotoma lepida]
VLHDRKRRYTQTREGNKCESLGRQPRLSLLEANQHFGKFLLPGGEEELVTVGPYNLSPLSSRTWLAPSFQVCMKKIQCYHTSPCNFKRQQKEAVLPSRTPSTITYLPDSPKPALYISLVGLIPFVAPPLTMVITKSYIPILALTQMAYGTSFLAFLGGVRWGFALPESSPAKPDYINLASSMSPVLFSWLAVLFSERLSEAIVMVIIGLGVALHNELFLLPHYPNWFKALRI